MRPSLRPSFQVSRTLPPASSSPSTGRRSWMVPETRAEDTLGTASSWPGSVSLCSCSVEPSTPTCAKSSETEAWETDSTPPTPDLHFIFSLLAPEPQVSDRRPGSRRLQSLLCFCCILNSVVVLITYLSNINRNVLTSSKTQHLTVF